MRTRDVARTLSALVLGLAFAAGGCNMKEAFEKIEKAAEKDRQAKAEKLEKGEPAVTATVAEILKAYGDNELAADKKYKGKVVEITGVLSAIAEGMSGNPELTLAADELSFERVECALTKADTDKALELKTGQTLVVRGIGDGVFFNVEFDPCKIVKVIEAPAQPEEPATTLEDEPEDDPEEEADEEAGKPLEAETPVTKE